MSAQTWFEALSPEALTIAQTLSSRTRELRAQGHVIYPPQEKIFRALDETPMQSLKVVLVGQDPYINPGQAEGLCFSVAPGTPAPPSLRNIFTELCSDVKCPRPTTTSLLPWAHQGVLLLNTALTVEAGQSNSHADWGWDKFTHDVFRVASELPQPVVFLAWGRNAQRALDGLDVQNVKKKKALLTSAHPSPFSADRGFFGSRPFSRTNQLLSVMGAEPVDWQLP